MISGGTITQMMSPLAGCNEPVAISYEASVRLAFIHLFSIPSPFS